MSDDEQNIDAPTTEDVAIPPMDDASAETHENGNSNENETKESVVEAPTEQPTEEPTTKSTNTSSKPVPKDLKPDSAWKEISVDSPSINWYLFGVDKKLDLVFKCAGQKGLQELTDVLQNSSSELLFGLLRVNSNDRGGSKRAKFVYVRFVGSSVSVMQKAKITPSLGKIGDMFPVKHMTYDLTEDLGNFTIDALAKEMLRVGGAHKPDSFDFGPNQVYHCK